MVVDCFLQFLRSFFYKFEGISFFSLGWSRGQSRDHWFAIRKAVELDDRELASWAESRNNPSLPVMEIILR